MLKKQNELFQSGSAALKSVFSKTRYMFEKALENSNILLYNIIQCADTAKRTALPEITAVLFQGGRNGNSESGKARKNLHNK